MGPLHLQHPWGHMLDFSSFLMPLGVLAGGLILIALWRIVRGILE